MAAPLLPGAAADPVSVPAAGGAAPGAAGYILVAEDNPVNQRVARAMLENLGYLVDVVPDGAAAVSAAALVTYSAILMDCHMPVLDGYEATSEIRRLPGRPGRIPIIAVTASAMKSDEERCLAAGMDDYLAKPLRLKVLGARLARWAPGPPGTTALADHVQPAAAAEAGPPPVYSDRPVLDTQVVGHLERMGAAAGEDLMGQLAALFLTEATAHLLELRRAVTGDDAAAVSRSAHTLCGASANVGATDLASLCASLATAGAAGDLTGGTARVDAVEAELGRVRSVLDARMPAA